MKVIITNWALSKMKKHGLSEAQVLDAFHNGKYEKKSGGEMMIKKYPGYEIGVLYSTKAGKYIIRSAWKRGRR